MSARPFHCPLFFRKSEGFNHPETINRQRSLCSINNGRREITAAVIAEKFSIIRLFSIQVSPWPLYWHNSYLKFSFRHSLHVEAWDIQVKDLKHEFWFDLWGRFVETTTFFCRAFEMVICRWIESGFDMRNPFFMSAVTFNPERHTNDTTYVVERHVFFMWPL